MTRFRALAATVAALVLSAPAALADPPPTYSGSFFKPGQKPQFVPPTFEGLWRTHTSANGHFDLRLFVSGDKVTGGFTTRDGQPQYNGNIYGTLIKKYGVYSFEFTYEQPQINAKGKGTFEQSEDGKRIAGVIYPEGPTRTYFNWDGERVDEFIQPR